MGGGGAMRSVAKVAGCGIFGGFRQLPSLPVSELAASTGARKCPPAVPAIVSAADTVSSASTCIDASAAVKNPFLNIDDWELAGCDEGELFDSAFPPSRLVFGGVPTIEEAREATSDLRDALEKVYFSSPIVTGAEGSPVVLGSHRSGPLSMENAETKTCIASESVAINPSVPKPVLNAFYLLKESPEVQTVVTSLASDKNVWEAVMKNEKVMEFYRSQKAAGVLPSDLDKDMVESCTSNAYLMNSANYSVEQSSETSESGFSVLVDNIKMQLTKMVSNLSELFRNLFGSSAEKGNSVDGERGGFPDFRGAAGFSFIALGILAILVVLLKRK